MEQTVAEAEQDDASSKLSLSEKLALFNKLSQPLMPRAPGGTRESGGTSSSVDASERRRQKGARYRTQPITADEVNLVSMFMTASAQSPSWKHHSEHNFVRIGLFVLYYSSEVTAFL